MDTLIKKSKIQGKGVFANRDFKKGEVIFKWDISNQLTEEEIEKLSKKDKRYINTYAGKKIFMQPPERYVNHSCNPNTNMKNFSDIAIRDIKKGEEITTKYSDEGIKGAKTKCNCGADNCKNKLKEGVLS